MKNLRFLVPACLSLILATATQAAPYPPEGRVTRWTQPDGRALELRVFGDDYHARTENIEGYTVVRNPADNAYHHASLSADGRSLVPMTALADQPAPAGLPQHLDLPEAEIRRIVQANRAKYDGNRAARWEARVRNARNLRQAGQGKGKRAPARADLIQAAPVTGAKRGLTILVQFPNDPRTPASDPVNFPTTRDKITRFCNDVGYGEDGNTGSVRDYFRDQSLGALDYTQSVTQVVTMPRARNYYNFSDYPTNRVFRSDASRVLIIDAIAALQRQGYDFTNLTVDGFSRAVATNVFFAGPDSGQYAEGLWPQSWSLDSPVSVGTTANPVFISNFQITNIDRPNPVIGTFCHENGHMILDLPDIYSLVGEGVGQHCLMGSGNHLNGGRTPSPINGHFKNLVGWGNVTEVLASEFRTVSLSTTGNIAYRIRKPGAPTESFLVEHRGTGDKWARFSSDTGVAIWHIDENIDGNINLNLPYGVALKQADGREDLELGRNRGDSTDLYDASRASFDATTTPNSDWRDLTASSVKVEVLTISGSNASVLFGAVPPNTILVDSPNGGEVIFPGTVFNLRWRANLVGNVRLELHKAGVFASLISANEVNDGNFTWAVPAALADGRDYALRVSSLTNPVATSDLSDRNFSVSRATFPLADSLPYGWFKPGGSSKVWRVAKSAAYEGTRSLVSSKTQDGKSSGIAYRSNFADGNVSFYMRVSSEEGFDHGRFYIDDQLQSFENAGAVTGLSGKTGWVFASFPVSAGDHTLKWTFEKDDSYAGLDDSAWLDGVSLPETTQEIAVADPQGVDVVSGSSTTSFPGVPIRSTGAPQVFTITNRGQADLHGIRIIHVGAAASEFVVRNLGKTFLAPGASTTFEVVSAPTVLGARSAGIQILSNDADEGAFAIGLEGSGLGIPVLSVSLAGDGPLGDQGKAIGFGSQVVGRPGKTRTFTVRNDGSSDLNGLAVALQGKSKDFLVGPLGAVTLAPGASTDFIVTFQPRAPQLRLAALELTSNDSATGRFDIKLSGKGVLKSSNSAASHATAATGRAAQAGALSLPSTSVDVVDGRKFLALTATKPPGISGITATIEVSSNLIDWLSGDQHTTVVIDNAAILKVRDNTPISPGGKRYIRLR